MGMLTNASFNIESLRLDYMSGPPKMEAGGTPPQDRGVSMNQLGVSLFVTND